MTRPHDLAADLPPPNPDEPATLRQDIVDELADHLACAARQEALRAELDTDGETPDEQTITDRVLARFGDPRRIARRLWFDAMKGRLMMQKLTAAFAALGAAAAIAACVLLWSAVAATKSTLANVVEENRKDRAASEKADQAMLAQLARLEAAAQKPQSPGWNPLRFKLVLGEEGTKPAVGYTVKLQGEPYRETRIASDGRGGRRGRRSLDKKSGDDGIVDFGLVRPGSYRVTFVSPWDYSRTQDVLVPAGSKTDMTIRCPTEKAERTRLKIELALPADLAKQKLAAFVRIPQPQLKAGNAVWTFPQPDPAFLVSTQFGTLQVPYFGPGGLGIQAIEYFAKPHAQTGTLGILDIGRGGIQSVDTVDAWTLPYKVETLAIVLPAYPELPGLGDVGGGTGLPGGPMGIVGPGPMGSGGYGPMGGLPMNNFVLAYISYGKRRPLGLFSENPPTFTPQAGKENVWKITLPPKLIEQARAAMKKVDRLKKKPDGKKS
jgi:hypothetical protein